MVRTLTFIPVVNANLIFGNRTQQDRPASRRHEPVPVSEDPNAAQMIQRIRGARLRMAKEPR